VRGKIASAPHLHAPSLQIAGLIGDARSHGIDIGSFADEMQAQPMIARRGGVFEQQRPCIVDGN
jgi:hypothetical protein